jgi:hypothetical protein
MTSDKLLIVLCTCKFRFANFSSCSTIVANEHIGVIQCIYPNSLMCQKIDEW